MTHERLPDSPEPSEEQPIAAEPFDRNRYVNMYAEYLGVEQQKGESDDGFRKRIAGILRSSGQIIEAHEVYSGRRYDDPEQGRTGPMAGILGATAQALAGFEYFPNDPERQIGADIAAGVVVSTPRDPLRDSQTNPSEGKE